jgi:hypothetical protein
MPIRIMPDSTFVISLLGPNERNHEKAEAYFRYFLDSGIEMHLSSIVASEIEVPPGSPALPVEFYIPQPFNVEHGIAAANLAQLLRTRQPGTEPADRIRSKDDTKILAHALALGLDFIISSDRGMCSRCEWLRTTHGRPLRAINLNDEYSVRHFSPDDPQAQLL